MHHYCHFGWWGTTVVKKYVAYAEHISQPLRPKFGFIQSSWRRLYHVYNCSYCMISSVKNLFHTDLSKNEKSRKMNRSIFWQHLKLYCNPRNFIQVKVKILTKQWLMKIVFHSVFHLRIISHKSTANRKQKPSGNIQILIRTKYVTLNKNRHSL